METFSARKSFLRTLFDACIDARRRDAQRRLNGALLMMDDATLTSHGYDREVLGRRPNVATLI